MTRWTMTLSLAALACGACNQAQTNNTAGNEIAPSAINEVAPAPPAATETVGTNVTLPDDRTPLEEPNGPIDPKSAEGAGQVVQHYGALIEQERWSESWKLWSNPEAAKAFDRNWRDDAEVHMEIGRPGGMEGAAGSSYISVPAIFYGKTNAGQPFRRGATVTLRRVNDVPGSTEAQRRWHIERVQWKAGT